MKENNLLKENLRLIIFSSIMFVTMLFATLCFASTRLEVANERCEQRKEEIIKILTEEGVRNPEFYYYLALAESTCQDDVVSHAGAKSMWQMMPWLIKNNDVTDWKNMTKIAGGYISSIQKRIPKSSDWLVVASWNTGLHNLQKRCGKNPTEVCVRNKYPQAAELADKTSQWHKMESK